MTTATAKTIVIPATTEFTKVQTTNARKNLPEYEKKSSNTSPINILVQLLNGKTQNIIIRHTNINIETLIRQISQETRTPIRDLRVLYQNKELNSLSKALISELNIRNGSILDIRLRIKGGGGGGVWIEKSRKQTWRKHS